MKKINSLLVRMWDGERYLSGEVTRESIVQLNRAVNMLDHEIADETTRVTRRQRKQKIIGVKIYTDQTIIPHSLGTVPFWYDVHFTGQATISWRQTQPPDEKFLYLEANAVSTADIIVEA